MSLPIEVFCGGRRAKNEHQSINSTCRSLVKGSSTALIVLQWFAEINSGSYYADAGMITSLACKGISKISVGHKGLD